MVEKILTTTGGTINPVYFDQLTDYQVGDSMIDKILTEAYVTVPGSLQAFLQKDSLDIIENDRTLIKQAVHAAVQCLVNGTVFPAKTVVKNRELNRFENIFG